MKLNKLVIAITATLLVIVALLVIDISSNSSPTDRLLAVILTMIPVKMIQDSAQ